MTNGGSIRLRSPKVFKTSEVLVKFVSKCREIFRAFINFIHLIMEKEKFHIEFDPHLYYHVFSRAGGNKILFKSNGNYFYFLQELKDDILSVSKKFALRLLPNHFHLLTKIRDGNELKAALLQNGHFKLEFHKQDVYAKTRFSEILDKETQKVFKTFESCTANH